MITTNIIFTNKSWPKYWDIGTILIGTMLRIIIYCNKNKNNWKRLCVVSQTILSYILTVIWSARKLPAETHNLFLACLSPVLSLLIWVFPLGSCEICSTSQRRKLLEVGNSDSQLKWKANIWKWLPVFMDVTQMLFC